MRSLQVLLAAACLVAPAFAEAPRAAELVERSIAYHDPKGAWATRGIELVSRVDLTQRLAKARGYAERVDRITVDNGQGRFAYRSTRVEDEIEIVEVRGDWTVRVNGSTEVSQEAMDKHRLAPDQLGRWRDYFTYMFGIPMKLRDPGTRLDTMAQRTDFHGRDVWSVRVTYSPEVGKDVWDFFFDPGSYALVGCRFFHDEAANDGEYLIFEDEARGPYGLRLPKKRHWYMNRDGEHIATDTILSIRRSASWQARYLDKRTGIECA